jgi:hydrogenase maturation protease
MAWSDGSETGGGTAPDAAPYQLLDDGFAPEPCELLVIGCGNILRGDDAVGPVLVRHLFERGVPDGVRVVDGGTSGMDVAFGMRGAARVVIVDAAATGAEPGTVYRVPAEELAELPPIDGLHTHNFRWDHALSFSAWLLGPERPSDVTVYLVEAASLEPGAPLTPAVEAGMWRVVDLVERDHFPSPEGSRWCENDRLVSRSGDVWAQTTTTDTIELTPDGYLHVPADLAERHFPGDAVVARLVDDEGAGRTLELVPLASVGHGGLLLKRRNAAGDRSALIHQELDFTPVAGRFEVEWDDDRGALLVPLDPAPDGSRRGDRGAHRGGGRARPVDGLPGGDHAGGGGAPTAGDASHGGAGEAGSRRRAPDGRAAARSEGGAR